LRINQRIEHRRAFSVLGIQSDVIRGSEAPELFATIWEKFEKEIEVIESLSLSGKYYGVNFPAGKEEISEYLAGMMVSDDAPVPEGLVKRNVPGGDYAVFECPVEAIGMCYQNIFTKWFPASPIKFNPGYPVFEEYPEKDSPLQVRIHIPVEKDKNDKIK
jgi:predicted transcriptional regulator YdeE